jgi:hypothetical protein
MQEEAANDALKMFMASSPGFNENLFKAKNG